MKLLECLRDVKDPRHARGIRHSSEEILIITLLALISGRGRLSSIAEYSKSRWKELKEEFSFRYKTSPDRTTISRFLSLLSLKEFQEKVTLWIEEVAKEAEVVSVDGKTAKGSSLMDKDGNRRQLAVLSVFAHEYYIVLEQYKMIGSKEYEPLILRENLMQFVKKYPLITLFMMDSLYANRPMIEAMASLGRNYIMGLKDNWPTLFSEAEKYFGRLIPSSKPGAVSYDKKKRSSNAPSGCPRVHILSDGSMIIKSGRI
ncbi:MAG: ISAs1 family transposase [Acidobacteriota bacterium]|jgi:hypothetical protein